MPSRPISPSSPPPTTSLKSKVLFIAITTSATCVIILTLLYIIYHFWHSTFSIFSIATKRSHTSSSPFDSLHPSLTKFTYRQLKSATNHFSPDNYIGKGGSGSVYRGILRNGKSVAVKKIDFIDPITSLQSEREFQNELAILGSGIRSDHVVFLLGYCFEKDKRILVYEYMPNKSLQELLFSEEQQQQAGNSVGVLGWDRRFKIMQDVALALEFLHNQCDPPVIHGDVKPSNVLLDWDLRAKLSDFGLSRVKLDEEGQEIGIGCRSRDLVWKSQDLSGNLNLSVAGGETPLSQDLSGNLVPGSSNGGGGDVDLPRAPLQASGASTNNYCSGSSLIPKGKEVVMMRRGGAAEYIEELELELNPSTLPAAADRRSVKTKQYLGKDWWWKQDGMSEEVVMCSSKDYVMEWIGCQIVPTNCSPDSDWVDHPAMSSPTTVDNNSSLHKNDERDRHQDHLKEQECCPSEEECEQAGYIKDGSMIDDKESSKVGNKKEPKQMQEWWKEENLQEMTNSKKGSKRRSLESKLNHKRRRCNRALHIHHLSRCLLSKWWRCRSRTKTDRRNCDLTTSGGAGGGEFSFFTFKRGWRRKKQQQHKRAASNVCSDMWSGDLLSRELSSTTSMRGTLCYVAPEYGGGGCGYLMEKTDIYSLGVLILVIVSGRRPLHVLNSPMELEKANLVTYCRHLAQVGNGNVLELVDDKLREVYDKEQATVCINLALACLQRMPELRPEIGDVVKVLRGEMDLPPPPFEFSPSPPSKMMSSTSRSRRKKQKMNVVEQS